jgi:hypothetical protein
MDYKLNIEPALREAVVPFKPEAFTDIVNFSFLISNLYF